MRSITRSGAGWHRRMLGSGVAVLAVAASAAVVLPSQVQPAEAALSGLTPFEIDTPSPNTVRNGAAPAYDWYEAVPRTGNPGRTGFVAVSDANYGATGVPLVVDGVPDGNKIDPPPYYAQCANSNSDTIFKGGTKIDDPDWRNDVTLQGVIDKGDLCQVFFGYEVVPTGARQGHIIGYTGFTRRDDEGDASIFFLFTTAASVDPNLRVPGDSVIQIDYNGQGDPTARRIARWQAGATPGSLPVLGSFVDIDPANIDAGPIKFFGELAIDLTALGLAPNVYSITDPAQCRAVPTGRVITQTGNAGEEASLKDDSTPITVDFDVCGKIVVKKNLTQAASPAVDFPVTLTAPSGVNLGTRGSVTLRANATTAPTIPTVDASTTTTFPIVGNPVQWTQIPPRLTPGVGYTLAESLDSLPWDHVSTVCVNDKGTAATGDDTGAGVNVGNPTSVIQVGPQETVTCTITNEPEPVTITVAKDVAPDGTAGTATWPITVTGPSPATTEVGSGSISETTTYATGDLDAGTYTITEGSSSGLPAGEAFRPLSWACSIDGVAQPVQVGASATLTLTPGQAGSCTITNQQVPGPDLRVTKAPRTPSFAEPAGSVTYDITVYNDNATEAITLTSLSDALTGAVTSATPFDLNLAAPPSQVRGDATLTASDCNTLVGQSVAAAGSASCAITVSYVNRDAGESLGDTVTVQGQDAFGRTDQATASATVTVTNVVPPITVTKANGTQTAVSGQSTQVTFSVTVTNTSTFEPVTISELVDNVEGTGEFRIDAGTTDTRVLNTTCPAVPFQLGFTTDTRSVTCTFTVVVDGAPFTEVDDIVTARGTEEDGVAVSGQASATTPVEPQAPQLQVNKQDSGEDALPPNNTEAIVEPGAPGKEITYTIQIKNVGQTTVTIDSVTDAVRYTVPNGTAPDYVLPGFSVNGVTTTSSTQSIASVGGTGVPTSVTLVSTNCDLVGTTLAPDATATCSFVLRLTGEAGALWEDRFEVTGTDTENKPVTGVDFAATPIIDRLPDVSLTKDASVASVPETGGSVSYTFTVTNNTVEPVTITSLLDNRFGELTTPSATSTCDDLGALAGSASVQCTFTTTLQGPAGSSHVNVATVTVTDNEGNTDTASDDATVTFADVPENFTIVKDPSPLDATVSELGGQVSYVVTVTNLSVEPATLTSLTDTRDGSTIDLATLGCTLNVPLAGAGTPDGNDPDDLPDDTYRCTFTAQVPPADQTKDVDGQTHVNVVAATLSDGDGAPLTKTDDASVPYTDVAPTVSVTKDDGDADGAYTDASNGVVSEPGGTVTYQVRVTNTSAEPAIVTTLEDAISFVNGAAPVVANLLVPAAPVSNVVCDVSLAQPLAPGQTVVCTFDVAIPGDVGIVTDVVTAVLTDLDGTSSEPDTAEEGTPVNDVAPLLSIAKTATPLTVNEPGGDVTFTVVATNESPIREDVKILSIEDLVVGAAAPNDLVGECVQPDGTTLVTFPLTVAAGAPVEICRFTLAVTGDAGDLHEDTVTVTYADDELEAELLENPATVLPEAFDDAVVEITDVLPTVTIVKTANPIAVPELGGSVTFTFVVTNTSVESVDIQSLTDTVFGDLTTLAGSDCGSKSTLTAGEVFTCTYTTVLSGSPSSPHTNTAIVVVIDNEENTATSSEGAQVDYIDGKTAVTIVKSADKSTVGENGEQVVFTFQITNGTPEPVTVTSLTDTVFGDLRVLPGSTCGAIAALAGNQTVTCTYTTTLGQDDGPVHTNVATVVVVDDEKNEARSSDDETVTIVDTPPSLSITKTPSVSSIIEPGGPVTFTIVATNSSPIDEDAFVTRLVDSDFGDLTVECLGSEFPQVVVTTEAPVTLCTFTRDVVVTPTTPHNNVVTVTYYDDEEWQREGEGYTASDDATVTGNARTIQVVAEPACKADTPYLKYRVVANFRPSNGPTITFKAVPSNPDQRTYPVTLPNLFVAQQDGTFVQDVFADEANWVLWPGTKVVNGVTTDWPGWDQLANGDWVKNPGDEGGNLRPEAFVTVEVNPTADSATFYPPPTPNCNTNPAPKFQVLKTGEAALVPGSTFTYTLKVTNTGGDASGPITLNDPLPAPLTYRSHDVADPVPDSACTGSGSSFGCTFDPAALPGGGGSLTISLTVNVPSTITAGTYRNVVVVGNDEDPPPPPATCVPGVDPKCDDEVTTVLSSLPETGADGVWSTVGLGAAIAGLGGVVLLLGRRRRTT